MKNKFIALVLCALFTMPCLLRAEEVEIQLMAVISMGHLPGDNPLDDEGHMGNDPACPTCFRATIDGHLLAVTILEPNIPAAQVSVVNAATGGMVLNQNLTSTLSENIANTGAYVLHIETEGGALVGQFIVQ